MIKLLLKLASDRRGATAIEYGLIISLIVIAIVGAIHAVGGTSGSMWDNSAGRIAAVEP